MGDLNDIYQLRTQMVHEEGQVAFIVCYYQIVSLGGTITAENVADDFVTEVLTPLATATNEGNVINRLYTINGMDNEDFNDTNPSLSGSHTGNNLPAVQAAGIRGPWPGPGFNRARHNLMAGSGSDNNGSGRWSDTFKATLQAVADNFGAQLELTGGLIDPVTIGGGFKLGVAPTFRGSARGQWEINIFPTTQKGRQDYAWLVQP